MSPADVTIGMKNVILNQNEGDGDVIICAVLTGPTGGLGQSVTVQFTAPTLSLNGQLTSMFVVITNTWIMLIVYMYT